MFVENMDFGRLAVGLEVEGSVTGAKSESRDRVSRCAASDLDHDTSVLRPPA